jgi:putative transposase
MIKHSPFRYIKPGPEVIRLAIMLYVRFSLSLRNVEDLLHERGVEESYETFSAVNSSLFVVRRVR